jgi:4-hydroxy-tetrahydrodipicolinate reductase
MSIGINLIAGLLGNVVKILDSDYDVEILEMHHRLKKDSPSGTALMLAESMLPYMKNGGILPYDRNGVRTPGKIGIASLRGGAGAGEHRVIFAGPGECLEFTHKAHNRGIYAKGAVFAALWSKKQNSGLYSMQDVLFS